MPRPAPRTLRAPECGNAHEVAITVKDAFSQEALALKAWHPGDDDDVIPEVSLVQDVEKTDEAKQLAGDNLKVFLIADNEDLENGYAPSQSALKVWQLCQPLDDPALRWLIQQSRSLLDERAEKKAPANSEKIMQYVTPVPKRYPDADQNTQDEDTDKLRVVADEMLERFLERDIKNIGEPPADLLPTVGFESPIIYTSEECEEVEVAIERIGNTDRESKVHYQTQDISAKAGKKYEATLGTLTFKEGETLKKIRIRLLKTPTWDATLEFKVELLEENLEHAVLTGYGRTTRVKIVDGDVFPSNRYQKAIEEGRLHEVNFFVLLWDYIKINLQDDTVRRGTRKTMLVDMAMNFYFILEVFLDLWTVNFALCPECDPTLGTTILALNVVLRVLPFPLLHYLDYRKAYWKVGGASRLLLQVNLLRKYLSYDDVSLMQVNESRLILALTRDSAELVEFGYCSIIKIVAAFGRMLLIIVYQLIIMLYSDEFSGRTLLQRFFPLVVYPIAMCSFLKLRDKVTRDTVEETHVLQNELIDQVRRVTKNYSLIQDYRKRGSYVDIFAGRVAAYNLSFAHTTAVFTNNFRFGAWCTLFVVALYTPIGGLQVINGGILLGTFLNNIAICKALGQLWTEMYKVVLEMVNVFDSLQTVVQYMNLTTDVPHRMAVSNRNIELCQEKKAQAVKETSSKLSRIAPADRLCIEMRHFSFEYKSSGVLGCHIKDSTLCLPQGGLYTFTGPHSEGKGTVLRLFGEVLLPFMPGFDRNAERGGGELIIPPHLRTLHVSKEPLFVQRTLLQNLVFGCAPGTGNDNKERIMAICKKLGMSSKVLDTIEQDTLVTNWLQTLSSTEAALLHIARALVANPEVLILHKPTLFLNNQLADNMYAVLKEFVEKRGLEKPASSFYQRRPRTCLVTARRVAGAGARMADAVYRVTHERGLELISVASSGPATED
eukprot:TRINITY_DN26785_c0_g1_i2.p1 TRINITY_DN26785_c0_g1~~TRINITY_DN26785_c0_g1_i2.p1  ORF type:complete len:946 (+),score=170.58 TRINITY_DN26785_c0_g1_i2:30-2867(+)